MEYITIATDKYSRCHNLRTTIVIKCVAHTKYFNDIVHNLFTIVTWPCSIIIRIGSRTSDKSNLHKNNNFYYKKLYKNKIIQFFLMHHSDKFKVVDYRYDVNKKIIQIIFLWHI